MLENNIILSAERQFRLFSRSTMTKNIQWVIHSPVQNLSGLKKCCEIAVFRCVSLIRLGGVIAAKGTSTE